MKQNTIQAATNALKNTKSTKHLIWIIPMMITVVTLVSFLGMSFAAVILRMRTMSYERRALKLYIEEQEQRKRAVRRGEI